MISCLIAESELQHKFSCIRAILLDWDGVFNNGFKQENGSGFSETDSMGLNLLRYSIFLKSHSIPYVGLISGEKNPAAIFYSRREHFHACYFSVKDKSIALQDFLSRFGLNGQEVIYFFDDVLDLPVARRSGMRAYIGHPSRNKFQEYLIKEKLVDIMSDLGGGNHALRELCEYLMDKCGTWSDILRSREKYDDHYKAYIHERNVITTAFYTCESSGILPAQPD
jgi:3-deoxy-D-manno-octulosonate 8-phosphate phosphatase (KDO 8-P phosphatase)